MIGNTVVVAVRQLWRNLGRTMLTSLGILIGVAAVIVMVSVASGATAAVEGDLAGLGEDLLFLVPGAPRHGPGSSPARPFDEADVRAIREQVLDLEAVAPTTMAPIIATWGDADWTTSVTGATPEYFEALGLDVPEGRPLDAAEAAAGAEVCVLGETVRRELFGAAASLDAQVRLGKLTCRVIGIAEVRGQNTFGQDQDDFVLVPLRTFQRRIGGQRRAFITTMFLKGVPGIDTAAIQQQVVDLMRERRHIRPGTTDDFTVRDMKEIAEMLKSISTVLTSLLAAVAAVSLLVGGIGIMNIMLVSVTERTREIGIRLAVGALARDVLMQFLVESVVLSLVGGIAGIAVGWGASAATCALLEIPFEIDVLVALGAFGFSALIGVAFGYFPARRAAHLDPIEALRRE